MSTEVAKAGAVLPSTSALPEVPPGAGKEPSTSWSASVPSRKKTPTWSLRRSANGDQHDGTGTSAPSQRKQSKEEAENQNFLSTRPQDKPTDGIVPYSMDNLGDVVKAWSKFKSSKKSTHDQALTTLVKSFIALCDSSDFPAAEGGVNSFGHVQIKDLCAASARRIASQLTSLVTDFTPTTAPTSAATSVLTLSREPPQQISECFTVLRIVLSRKESTTFGVTESISMHRRGSVNSGTIHTAAGLETWRTSVVAAISEAKLPSAIVFALEKLIKPRSNLVAHNYSVDDDVVGNEESQGGDGSGECGNDRSSSASDDSSCGSEKGCAGSDAFETKWGVLVTFLSLVCGYSSVANELISSDALHTLFMISLAKCNNMVANTIRDYIVDHIMSNIVL